MNDSLEVRRRVGLVLRSPFVLFAALFWIIYVWWWLAGLVVGCAVAMLIIQPLAYPFIYGLYYLALAFQNSDDEVLPDYWSVYPRLYLEWAKAGIKLGFPTLLRWLFNGF